MLQSRSSPTRNRPTQLAAVTLVTPRMVSSSPSSPPYPIMARMAGWIGADSGGQAATIRARLDAKSTNCATKNATLETVLLAWHSYIGISGIITSALKAAVLETAPGIRIPLHPLSCREFSAAVGVKTGIHGFRAGMLAFSTAVARSATFHCRHSGMRAMLQSQSSAATDTVRATCTSQQCAAILERVHSLDWVHSIDLGDGIITPAKCNWHTQSRLITRAFDCTDFQDKKVLDIGCWDGLWSFEAERRGAREVYATDYVSQRHSRQQPTFEVARDILRSGAKYFPQVSVFDVSQLGVHDFDIVLFCGVFYHLRDPLLAFARLRQVMKEGAVLIVEGDAIYNRDDASAEFFYHQWHNRDASNWWVPTIPCLRQWLESSFFGDLIEIRDEPAEPSGLLDRAKQAVRTTLGRPRAAAIARIAMTVRAVRRTDPNYFYPDDDLQAFDLNVYDAGAASAS